MRESARKVSRVSHYEEPLLLAAYCAARDLGSDDAQAFSLACAAWLTIVPFMAKHPEIAKKEAEAVLERVRRMTGVQP